MTAVAESWTPLLDASERAAVSRAQARPPFLLMAHPERWGVSTGKVRPILGRLKMLPGVSNVSVGPAGTTRIGMATIHYQERGWTILPATTLPPAQAHRKSYLTRPAGRPDVTLCYWEESFAGSSALRCDDGLRDEFLDYIVDAGLVPPPPLYVLERLRDQTKKEHADLADRARAVPSAKPAAADAQVRLKVLERAIAARSKVPAVAEPVLLDDLDDGDES